METPTTQKNIPSSPPSPVFSAGRDEYTTPLRYRVGFLLFLNAAALFSYATLFGFVLDKKDAIVDSVSKLSVEQLREEQLQALRESFRETENDRKELDRYFVNQEKLVSFIEEIERAGRHGNVALAFHFVNIREAENVLALEFETLGSFSETFYFLQLIERMPVRVIVEKFVMSKDIPRNFEKRKESDTWYAVIAVAISGFGVL